VRRIASSPHGLKYSRWVRVSRVKDETVESLVRSLAQHLDSGEERRWCGVFDRPKTVALEGRRNGEVSEWNPVSPATLEMASEWSCVGFLPGAGEGAVETWWGS